MPKLNSESTIKTALNSHNQEIQAPTDISLIGDSTIDNEIWIFPGIIGNAIMSKVGIPSSTPKTRVNRPHGLFAYFTELSVVENLMDMRKRSIYHSLLLLN